MKIMKIRKIDNDWCWLKEVKTVVFREAPPWETILQSDNSWKKAFIALLWIAGRQKYDTASCIVVQEYGRGQRIDNETIKESVFWS